VGEFSPQASGAYHLSDASISPSSRARPGISARLVPLSRLEIPALRCAAAGMTGVGEVDAGLTRWHVGVHYEVPPRRPFPERWSAAEPCPGSSTTMRRAAARDCLKTRRKRASRGVLRWTPDTLPLRSRVPGTCRGAALWVPGDVPRSRTLGSGNVRRSRTWVPVTCRSAALCLRVATPRTRAPAG